MLNGADIKQRERRDCEIRYLQNILADVIDASSEADKAQVQAMHPRLPLLVKKYGQVR